MEIQEKWVHQFIKISENEYTLRVKEFIDGKYIRSTEIAGFYDCYEIESIRNKRNNNPNFQSVVEIV
jgi:hypothetical protein